MHLVLPPSAVSLPRPLLETSTPPGNLRPGLLPSRPLQQDAGLRFRRPHGGESLEGQVAAFRSRTAALAESSSATLHQSSSPTDRTASAPIPQTQAQTRAEHSERLRTMAQDFAVATHSVFPNGDNGSDRPSNSDRPQSGPDAPLSPQTQSQARAERSERLRNIARDFATTTDSMIANNDNGADSPSNSDRPQSGQDAPMLPTHTLPADSRRYTLAVLLQRLVIMETQLRGNIAPSVEDVSRLRLQLHQLLDEQYLNPFEPREFPLESWLARLSAIAIRADQLRINLARTASGATQRVTPSNVAAGSNNSHHQMYMLNSPIGQHGLVVPNTSSPRTQSQALTTTQLPNTGLTGRAPVQPTFRVGIRATRRPRRRFMTALNLFLLTRAVWIFIRLFVVCYLVTPHGTWLRLISFILAAFVAIISQTRWPRRARRTIWDPIRRHLEGLVPLDDSRAQRPRPRGARQAGQATSNAAPTTIHTNQGRPAPSRAEGAAAEPTIVEGVVDTLLAAERSVVLFMATLIPGIGERFVAARNAADRAREEAERQREQEENERQQQENTETAETAGSSAPGPPSASPESHASQTESPSGVQPDSNVPPAEEAGSGRQLVDPAHH